MSDESSWRPFGVETEEEVARYDALHDGVPSWMETGFWAWVKRTISISYADGYQRDFGPNWTLCETMAEALQFQFPDLRRTNPYSAAVSLQRSMDALKEANMPLHIADYLLAHARTADSAEIESVLARCKSLWQVGERSGKTGLVRRVEQAVKDHADKVMGESGRAGVKLAKAWGALYGLNPDASEAYRYAIQAVEAAAIPIVTPTAKEPTLGTVIATMESQKDWSLPMLREHPKAATPEVLVGMLRVLWRGQHDRHEGEAALPGSVSFAEAKVAVGLAVTLVQWFNDSIIARKSATP